MKIIDRKNKSQSGSSIVETMIALVLMCLIFFGGFQLFQWAMARMFCDYSSFYAAKAYSLGYAKRTIDKAARIAAIPISGRDENGILKEDRKALANKLRLYMLTGSGGVHFPYWDAGSRMPNLRVSHTENPDINVITARVTLRNAPYVTEGFGNFLRITNRPVEPTGDSATINHCTVWMK